MDRMRSVAIALLGGGLAGTWTTALIGGKYMTWYHSPGGIPAQCACEALSTSIADGILHWELIGLVGGAVVGLVVYFVLSFRHARQAPRPPAPASPSGSAS